MEYIEENRPPGWFHYLNQAQKWDAAFGGITIVMPDGKWAHVPFQLDWTNYSKAVGSKSAQHLFMAAAKALSKHLAAQTQQVTEGDKK